MKILIWLRAACITFLVSLFAFIGFWIWARDDFFPRKLIVSAPPQSLHRVAIVSDFDMQNDGNHIIGVEVGQKWQRLTEIVTQSEMADQEWQLIWSRDGSLVALQQSAAMTGDPRVKKAFYSHAFDFTKNKRHESLNFGQEPNDPFSHAIETLMKQRGGAVANRQTKKGSAITSYQMKRDLGVWRWQDREFKDAF